MFDENGDQRTVKTLDPNGEPGAGIEPHKRYSLSTDSFEVKSDENTVIAEYKNFTTNPIPYFEHTNDVPLKYCVSKNHIVVTNPSTDPELRSINKPTPTQQETYYSFVNLKVIDTENYNYRFKLFTAGTDPITFNAIKEVDIENEPDPFEEYNTDLTVPWSGVVRDILLQPNDPDAAEQDPAVVRLKVRTQTYTFKSSDGDGYPTRVRHFTDDLSIITPGKGFKRGKITVIEPGVDDGPDVTLVFDITEVRKITSADFVDIIPDDISNNNDADTILNSLASKFKAEGIDKVIVVGNGIYLENSAPFSVSTSEAAVADVMNSQRLVDELTGKYIDDVPIVRVNTVAELPLECYEGFIVQVKNSFDSTNDYYLQYFSESQQEISGSGVVNEKADGFWEEIAKPFQPVNPYNYSMPHLITAVEEGETGEYAFVVSRMIYRKRTAGDISDNPSVFTDNAKIAAVDYYKNRLFFLTDIGAVVSSRAGDISNVFINTALRTSPIDPIDVQASTSSRIALHGSAVVNNGLVLFGDDEQYALTTSGDLLTSDTANITKVANYTFSPNSQPIYLGTNIGFVSNGLTRFYEMTNIYDRGPVDINERSQQVQTQFGQGFDMPVSSREQSQVVVYKRYKGLVKSSPEMMVYRFRQENSQESTQTSWVKWKIGGKHVAYVTLPEDKMYVVAADATGSYLWRIDSSSVDGLPARDASIVPKFTDGWTDDADGEQFETIIKFPTIYATGRTKTDITANLTIHRVKLSTAAIGTYDLTIDRKGYDSYKLLVEQTPADEYNANFPQLYGEKIETVPVYTRNKNLTLTMSTDYDAPLTLQSMTWEGDYNRPYYKSV